MRRGTTTLIKLGMAAALAVPLIPIRPAVASHSGCGQTWQVRSVIGSASDTCFFRYVGKPLVATGTASGPMAVVQVRLARILPNPLLAGGQPVPVAYCTGQGQGIASCREESDLELEYGTLIQCWGYGMVAGTFECWSGEKSPDEE